MLTLKELHDFYTISQLSCGLIEDLLIHPLQRTGRLSLWTSPQQHQLTAPTRKVRNLLEELAQRQNLSQMQFNVLVSFIELFTKFIFGT